MYYKMLPGNKTLPVHSGLWNWMPVLILNTMHHWEEQKAYDILKYN